MAGMGIGVQKEVIRKPVMLANTLPILGAFMICTEMCGSGLQIGLDCTQQASKQTQKVLKTGNSRTKRGGSWLSSGDFLRSAFRGSSLPRNSYNGADTFGFRLAFAKITEPPIELNSIAEIAVSGNQPIGTIVGEFNATDPDGDTITYHLVSGEGDGNNSLFTLDQNGTLKTAAVLDYEAVDSLSIRVQAKDELNATTEGNFTVRVLDIWIPDRITLPT